MNMAKIRKVKEKKGGCIMSKKEKKNFIRLLLSQSVTVRDMNCKVRLRDMFTSFNKAVVLIRKKDGTLLAVGL